MINISNRVNDLEELNIELMLRRVISIKKI